jgi:hypothetical protein
MVVDVTFGWSHLRPLGPVGPTDPVGPVASCVSAQESHTAVVKVLTHALSDCATCQ